MNSDFFNFSWLPVEIPKWAINTVALLNAAKGSVLNLCDRTGNMVQPWAAAGFERFCVDLRHREGEHQHGPITFIGTDLREWLPPPRRYAIVLAFPDAPPSPSAARAGLEQKASADCPRHVS